MLLEHGNLNAVQLIMSEDCENIRRHIYTVGNFPVKAIWKKNYFAPTAAIS